MSNTSWSRVATNDSVYISIYIYLSLSLLCTVQEVLAQRERERHERERFDDKAGMHFYNEKKDKKRTWIFNYQVEKLLS